MSDIIVGIDLGTTNSCAAYFWNNHLKVLENGEGDRITSSNVYFFENGKIVIGKYAKYMCGKLEHSVYEIKRLIGMDFEDQQVQNNLKYLTYKIENDDNILKVIIDQQDGCIKKTPTEISAQILKKIKSDIEVKLGKTITTAVITVPAYFNINQREATLEAASTAGLNVMQLLNEPSAAALSYFYENNKEFNGHALVYDLGGGTFDVAILNKTDNSNINMISVDGDTHLGGHDFDILLLEHVCARLEEEYKVNPKTNAVNMRRLMNNCEKAKKVLSFDSETILSLIGFTENPIFLTINRQTFEGLIDATLKRTITIMDQCLKASKLNKSDVKEIILVGGSTRIPKAQSMISEFFDGRILNRSLHPDESVAEGAALQAALLSKNPSQKFNFFKINDVTSLSLGCRNFVNEMEIIIPRNTTIPTQGSLTFRNVRDKQKETVYTICEGERTDARKNHYLGELIHELTPASPGKCKTILTFSIDHNGLFSVKAKEIHSGKTRDLQLKYVRGRRSEHEIQNIISSTAENFNEDQKFSKMAEMKQNLIDICIDIQYQLNNRNLTSTYLTIYDRSEEIQKISEDCEIGDEEKIKQLTEEIQMYQKIVDSA